MNIPKRFKLYGQTITVEMDKTLTDKEDARGVAEYRLNRIRIQDPQSAERPTEQMEQTFYHELVHWLLYSANYHKLNNDEDLVDRIGCLLHQALTTAEYE